MPKKKTKKKKSKIQSWKKPKVKRSIDDESINGKAERATRDGLTPNRIALPERIIKALIPIGTEKQGLWFTRQSLYRRIAEQGGLNPLKIPRSFHITINGLIKDGYIEKAYKPGAKVKTYIYRRTTKPYRGKVHGEKMNGNKSAIQKGFDLYHSNKRFPKWFRDMLH